MAVETVRQSKSFAKLIARDELPVLVALRASGCLPSQQLVPVIDDLAAEYDGRARFVAVDVEEEDWGANEVMRRYRLRRLPVVMLIEDGDVNDLIGGMTTKETLAQLLDEAVDPVRSVGMHNFEAQVLKQRRPVLVHFRAAWCAASREIEPLVETVAKNYRGRAKVVSVEFDERNAALCARYGVTRVPTLALFQSGEIVDQIMGAMTGGAKVGAEARSCVGLTSLDNISQMLDEFVA